MSSPDPRRRRFIDPEWPDEPFNLEALGTDQISAGWDIGPFTKDGFDVSPDGTLWDTPGGDRPVILRVTGQDGRVIHANCGDEGPMDYLIVPLSELPGGGE